jgi:hypothetical protein
MPLAPKISLVHEQSRRQLTIVLEHEHEHASAGLLFCYQRNFWDIA